MRSVAPSVTLPGMAYNEIFAQQKYRLPPSRKDSIFPFDADACGKCGFISDITVISILTIQELSPCIQQTCTQSNKIDSPHL